MEDAIDERFAKDFASYVLSIGNIVLGSHFSPDSDSLSSQMMLSRILKELNPNINVYPVIDLDSMTGDSRMITERYGFRFHRPDDPKIVRPDALNLLDTQMNERAAIPPVCSEMLKTGSLDVVCIDHHERGDFDYRLDYVDSKSQSTTATIIDLFRDTGFVREKLLQDEGLCMLGFQAIYVDTNNFRNLTRSKKDISALKMLSPMVDWSFFKKINSYILSEAQAKIQSVLLLKDNYVSIEPFSYCHVRHPFKTANDLGIAVNLMGEVDWTGEIIIASGIHSQKDELEDTLDISIRSRKDEDERLPEVARLFNGGGRKNAAGAQMPIGFFKHASKIDAYSGLFENEIISRLMSSDIYKEAVKKNEKKYDEPMTIERMIENAGQRQYSNLLLKIFGQAQYAVRRSNDKMLALGINVNREPKDTLVLGDKNIPAIIRLSEVMTEYWGIGDAEEVGYNLIYALIDNDVQPYLLSVHCTKSGSQEKEGLIDGLFGPAISESRSYASVLDNEEYEITIVKSRLPELRFEYSRDLLIRALDYEISMRMDRTLGEKKSES